MAHFLVLAVTAGGKNHAVFALELVGITHFVAGFDAHDFTIAVNEFLSTHTGDDLDAFLIGGLEQRFNESGSSGRVNLVCTLPKSAGTLTDSIHHRRTVLLHPMKCFKHIFGIGTNQGNMSHLVAAVVGLQGMPFGAVKKRLAAALQIRFVLGLNVGHQFGVIRVGRFFVDGLNDGILEGVRHRKQFLTFRISGIESAGAAKRIAADHRHLFQHNDVVFACFGRSHRS